MKAMVEKLRQSLMLRNALSFLFLVLALLVVLARQADAATPRAEVVLDGTDITLGDVFEGVTEHSGHVLAPAPQPGEMRILDARDLMRIAQAFGLDWRPSGMAQRTVIRSSAVMIGADRIREALQRAIAERLPGQEFDVVLQNTNAALAVPAGSGTDVVVSRMTLDVSSGTFSAAVHAAVNASAADDGKNAQGLHVAGKIQRMANVPVVTSRLRNGDIITKADIEMVRMDMKTVSSSVITNPERLVGMTPRRVLAPFQPVEIHDIDMPRLVEKGDVVMMELKNGALSLTAMGKSMQSGAAGEVVRVVNIRSNQTVEAVVIGDKRVQVRPAMAATVN